MAKPRTAPTPTKSTPTRKRAAKPAAVPAATPRSTAESRLPTLEACRARIDAIDLQFIELLDARARVAQRIGQIKSAEGKATFDAGRHLAKLNEIAQRGSGDFPVQGLRLVFGEILSACLALQAPQTVGYLGPEATFSHIAAVRAFGRSVDYQPCGSIPEIFEAVEKETVHYGIVPIENSTGGVIHTTLDELMNSNLSICAELHIPISHNLLCRGPFTGIKKVCSHPQILSQCRNWLRAHMPGVPQVETSSSAAAAAMAVKDKHIAAIGSELASRMLDLPMLFRRIEDRKDNITRFLIIGRQSPGPSGNDKTSVMFSIKDQPGALKKLLSPFSDRGLNLTKIESRPSRKRAWDYIFFFDVEGHMNDPRMVEALREMKPHTNFLRVLGSYPMDAGVA